VRALAFFFSIICLAVPARGEPPDPGTMQDTEAAREKILKASDQLDLIETNSEATKTSVDNMKADIAKLHDENSTLKQQLADLQAAFAQSEASRAKERQVLLDEVAKLVAAGKTAPAKSTTHKRDADADTTSTPPPAIASNTTPTPPPADSSAGGTTEPPTPTPKPQKGYYHTVAAGETLTLICTAYREQGIKVTVGEIQRANGLTEKSVLKVGQKLFIPKPGA
jgi:regulator of replication initiation timing